MKLETNINTKPFQDFLSTIPKGFEEAHLKITSEGFRLYCIDNARVLMTTSCLKKEAFEAYQLDGDFEIIFDVMRIKKFVGPLKASTIAIEMNEDRNIVLESNAMVYDLQVFNSLELGSPPEIPELEFDDAISLSTGDFKTYMEAANKIGTETTLRLENGEFFITSKTQSDKVVVKIPKDQLNVLDGGHPLDLKSSFGTGYLLSISNAVQFLDNIKLNLKNGSVLKVDGGRKGIDVEYLLAPLRMK